MGGLSEELDEGGTQLGKTQVYRGGTFSTTSKPLFLSIAKEYSLNPDDAVDQGVLKYFQDQGAKAVENQDRSVIKYPVAKNIPLNEILNLKNFDKSDLLKKVGIAPFLPQPGVGIIPLGMGLKGYFSIDQFRQDFAKRYTAFVQKVLMTNKDDAKIFVEAVKQVSGDNNLTLKHLDKLNQYITDNKIPEINIPAFMQFYSAFLRMQEPNLTPSLASVKKEPTKFFNLDALTDYTVSRFGERNGTWKAQGFLMVRNVKDARGREHQVLSYADPLSTNGSEVVLQGKTPDDVKPMLEQGLKFDAEKGPLTNPDIHGSSLEDHVKAGEGLTVVSLRRKDGSPIQHVDQIMDLSAKENQTVMIAFGEIDPHSNIRENKIIVTNYKI